MDKYEKYLIKYISETNFLDTNEIDTEVDIFENGYIDSIGIFTLLIEIENEFGKEILLDKISTLDIYSIKNIAKLIR